MAEQRRGRRFGRYRLLQRLGAGGMAVVYRAAVDGPRGFSREVVIKRINPELAGEPSFVEMLVKEGRLSALLRHPGIVQVHELGEVDGEYYLEMELVEGADLNRLLAACHARHEPLPVSVVCAIVEQIAHALAYAHAVTDGEGRPLHIVHRDISPSNIMVTPLGEVKLLDFGIAKAAYHFRDERTRTGMLLGKFGYFSPEQADGVPVDHRADIFALGIVLWEMLAHKRLFRGENDLETLRNVREAPIALPSTLRPEVPPELDDVVRRMLERDREARFQGCDEVAAALAPIARRDGDVNTMREFVARLGPLLARAAVPTGPEEPDDLDDDGALDDDDDVVVTAEPAPATVAPRDAVVSAGEPGVLAPPRRLGRLLAGAAALAGVATLSLLLVLRHDRASTTPAPLDPPPPASATPTATNATPPPTSAAPTAASAAPATANAAPATANAATVNAATVNAATANAATANTATAVAPAEPRPALVTLKIDAPAGADVVVDGKPIGTAPLSTRLPRARGARHVVVTQRGYRPWSSDTSADDDHELVVHLRKLPAAHRARVHGKDAILVDPFRP